MSGRLTRDQAIARIRAGLRRRTGKDWSVSGGRGTASGWIRIEAPPRRRIDEQGRVGNGGYLTSPEECRELAAALGLTAVSPHGETVPASSDYYQEYVDRAEGRAPSVIGKPYWD
jgi:hypothetical protein